jgi:hypothetical protein
MLDFFQHTGTILSLKYKISNLNTLGSFKHSHILSTVLFLNLNLIKFFFSDQGLRLDVVQVLGEHHLEPDRRKIPENQKEQQGLSGKDSIRYLTIVKNFIKLDT